MPKYIMRFDDICPKMDWEKFMKVKGALERYNIYSVLGVIPNNMDDSLNSTEGVSDSEFFNRVRSFAKYGDTIAQHGTFHLYKTQNSGILKINNYSEFAGLPYNEQLKKLSIGKSILVENDVWQPYFMAPAHSFDINTLKALKALDFEAITDGYGLYPYDSHGLSFTPQLVGKPIKSLPFGIQTICLHTESMSQKSMDGMINFIHENHEDFISFNDAMHYNKTPKLIKSLSYHSSKVVLRSLRSNLFKSFIQNAKVKNSIFK